MDRSITISEEDYKFLHDFVHTLNTQERLGTAQPVRYTIQSKQWEPIPEEYGYDKVEYYNPDDSEARYVSKEAAQKDGVDDPDVVYLRARWVDREHFFTQEAAEQHLRSNHYHYTEGRIYVDHFWRNPQVNRLLKTIATLTGKKIDGL